LGRPPRLRKHITDAENRREDRSGPCITRWYGLLPEPPTCTAISAVNQLIHHKIVRSLAQQQRCRNTYAKLRPARIRAGPLLRQILAASASGDGGEAMREHETILGRACVARAGSELQRHSVSCICATSGTAAVEHLKRTGVVGLDQAGARSRRPWQF